MAEINKKSIQRKTGCFFLYEKRLRLTGTKEAVESGHQKIEKSGGGELTIAGEDHLIRR